jgi:hypothetical protein
MLQPLGEHAGALNPPEPVGMPWGRTLPADISFFTFLFPHLGQAGFFLSDSNTSSSNRWSHFSQKNSYIGILIPLLWGNFILK